MNLLLRNRIAMMIPSGPAGYAVTYSLSNVTSSNTSTVASGSYTTTLTASFGYILGTVTVTMGGVDITSSAYSNGVITIADVTDAISITASATYSNYAYNDIYIKGNDGGYAWFGYGGTQDYMLSPMFVIENTLSVSFSVGGTRIGDLIYLNNDGSYRSYAISNANPRTLSFSSGYRSVAAICFKKANLSSTYVYDNTNSRYLFKGDELDSSLILGADHFRNTSPIAQTIVWENSRGDFENWNFTTSTTLNSANARSTYNPTIYRIIKNSTSTQSECASIITKFVTLPQNYTDGKSRVEFSVGKTYSGGGDPCLILNSDSEQRASYYTANANPRTVDIGAAHNKVRMVISPTYYSASYIKDVVTDTMLWQGPQSQ